MWIVWVVTTIKRLEETADDKPVPYSNLIIDRISEKRIPFERHALVVSLDDPDVARLGVKRGKAMCSIELTSLNLLH